MAARSSSQEGRPSEAQTMLPRIGQDVGLVQKEWQSKSHGSGDRSIRLTR